MSMLANVFDGPQAMDLPQLLLAFVACMAYGLAQGGLLGERGRRWAWSIATGGAAAFVVLAGDWTNAVVLVAIAIAGLGLLAALVWLTSRFIGIDRTTETESASAMESRLPVQASPRRPADGPIVSA